MGDLNNYFVQAKEETYIHTFCKIWFHREANNITTEDWSNKRKWRHTISYKATELFLYFVFFPSSQ